MVKVPDIFSFVILAIIVGIAMSIVFDRISKRKCASCNGDGCEGCNGTGEEPEPIFTGIEFKIPCTEPEPPKERCVNWPCPEYECVDGFWRLPSIYNGSAL